MYNVIITTLYSGVDTLTDISDKILKMISEKGITYSELSSLTKIPKSALQRYATGETEKIPMDRLAAIAVALGVTPAYLMGWEDEAEQKEAPVKLNEDFTKEEKQLMLAYRAASEDDKTAVKCILRKYQETNTDAEFSAEIC